MLNLLIQNAYAEGTSSNAAAGGNAAIAQIGMLVVFVLIFYFLLWRPQAKRSKSHRQLMTQLAKGDEVIIGGGLAGRIVKIGDEFITIEIAQGTEVNVQKSAVANVLPKGTLKSI